MDMKGYDTESDAKMDLLEDLLKKKDRLQKNLDKCNIELKLLDKDLRGGASLDEILGIEKEEAKE